MFAAAEFRLCPSCGAQIRQVDAVRCRFCGGVLEQPTEVEGRAGAADVEGENGDLKLPPRPTPGSRPLGQIGGWLALFIINLWLGALGAIGNAILINRSAGSPLPALSSVGLLFCSVLYCGVAVLSAYCARVLNGRKPNAVPTAKRCLVGVLILTWAAALSYGYLVIMPLGGSPLWAGHFVPQVATGATFWFLVWYSYLSVRTIIEGVVYAVIEGDWLPGASGD